MDKVREVQSLLIILFQMKVLYWNIRGLRRAKARDKLRNIVKKNCPSLVILAEPKIWATSEFIKKLRLPGMHFQLIDNYYEENKGNIWILWSASIISNTRQEITVEVGDALITRVHAATLSVNRRELWKDLVDINNLNKPWLVIGDFNTVMNVLEKKGGLAPLKISMMELKNCLNICGLIQAPSTGLDFPWCNNRAGRKRNVCNLDRAVFNDKWLELIPSWGYKVGARGISDHGVLYVQMLKFQNKKNVPFRALKVWMSHPDFYHQVQEIWKIHIPGNPIFVFMKKLKILKQEIKKWNWTSFGDITKKIKEAEDKVLQAALISDKNLMNLHLLNNLVTARGELEVLSDKQKEILQQKSRVKWLKEGASNSRFFHVNLKIRQAQNAIVELENADENIIYDQKHIDESLISHFEDKFKYQEVQFTPGIFQYIPRVLSDEDKQVLDDVPTYEEIKKAVYDLDPDSAPGTDGFAGWFFRFAWERFNFCNQVLLERWIYSSGFECKLSSSSTKS
ncbi:uncharacterized protein LOC113273178 [Papaver somniferum]|uniref:uncharacterized protein LOC113273178 n=1 Tax=Papaver somniferum TaxID=3469 RepID=UPI000E703F34|nr:uncharacterized protein LOC113273178 [Papaver somniferum]